MSYRINAEDGDLIIDGFEKGIGSSPQTGLTDMKNVNVNTIPGEASVGFKTSSLTTAPVYTSVTATAVGDGFAMTVTGLTSGSRMEIGQALSVSASTISGFTAGTLYYIATTTTVTGTSQNITVTGTYATLTEKTIGTTGTATISVVPMILGTRGNLTKNYFAESRAQAGPGSILAHWIADSNGRVWSDTFTTAGGTGITATNSWTYTGNTIDATKSNGNGLVYFGSQGSNGVDGWLFLFNNDTIDYLKVINNGAAIEADDLAWVYGWNPETGTIGQSAYLTKNFVYGTDAPLPHEAIVTPGGFGGFVNYCDSYNIAQFSQFSRGTAFNPQVLTSYNFSKFGILPIYDVASCLTYFGSNILIGGIQNTVYPWDLTSSSPNVPLITLPENNVTSIVTGNNNAYIFAGRRGRIYITNGSQANLWKKVPDHISGTVQPIFSWGAATYALNKLYFSIFIAEQAVAPDQDSSNNYGGVWEVDLETNAMYLSNLLTDGVYTGYTPALFTFTNVDAAMGYGFFAGWTNNLQTSSGVDMTVNTSYSGGESVIVSDLIPIGTAFEPTTPAQFEFKLTTPLRVNESIQLLVGSSLADYQNNTFTSLGTTTGTGSSTSATIISALFPNQIQTQQWLLVKTILTSAASNPSYVRLSQIRVKGATVSQSNQTGFVTE